MTDFINNLREKIREQTNYDEKTSEKRTLKEQLFRQQLQSAQTLMSKNEELPKRLRFDVVHHMKIYMSSDELKQLNAMKDEYAMTTYKVSAISLVNIICVSAFMKGFMNFKWYAKLGVASLVFCSSHYVGMYAMEQKTLQYQQQIIQNYREQFISSNFIKNKLTYDPSRPDPHLQVRQNALKPKLLLEEDIEESKNAQ